MKNIIKLQKAMKRDGIDFYIIDTFDPHGSEYIDDYFQSRQYFSGFTGSNGVLLVQKDCAYLWTDGRYFVQAEKELPDEIKLMRMGTKDITLLKYLSENVKKDNVVAFSGKLLSAEKGKAIEDICQKNKGVLKYDIDYADELWTDRPARNFNKVFLLDVKYTGEDAVKKIAKLRKHLKSNKLQSVFFNRLDDIAYITNLRGKDIRCNPVFYSYLFISSQEAILFANKKCLDTKVKQYLKNSGITVKNYEEVDDYLQNFSQPLPVLFDKRYISYLHYRYLIATNSYKTDALPVELMKAVKNKTEIKNLKDAYLKDSVAVTKFIKYIKEYAEHNITETKAAEYIDNLRKEIPGFIDLSFDTISAFGSNAAMMHYEAKKGDEAVITKDNVLLVDSGGQYLTGTTDVTRTIVLGDVPDELKNHYTRTVMGMLRLQNAIFIKGCTGKNLDILARGPLWEIGLDYKCGTGHGIGFVLNVHEGPHNIHWGRSNNTPIEPGMIVSDEPGVYLQDRYGIRIENIILAVKADFQLPKGAEISNADDEYVKFQALTLVPIDLEGINPDIMSSHDIKNLNDYHKLVYKKISPYLSEEEKVWLKQQTREIL